MQFQSRTRLRSAILAALALLISLLPAYAAIALTPAGTPTVTTTSRTQYSFSVSFTGGVNSTSTTATVFQADGITPVVTVPNFSSGNTINGLTAGTTYMYQLTAIGDGTTYSNSTPTALASITTTTATYAGGAATTPTPTLGTTTPTSAVINITFTPTTVNTLRLFDSSGTTLLQTINTTSSSFTFSGLVPSTSYMVSNKALGDGLTFLEAAESAKLSFTTPARQTLSAVTNLAANPIASDTVTFTYTVAPNATDHVIRIYNSSGTTLFRTYSASTTTSLNLNQFQPGVSYRASIQPKADGVGYLDGPESAQISFTLPAWTGGQLAQGTNVAGVPSGATQNRVQFTYTAPANATASITRLYANDGVTLIQQATQAVIASGVYTPYFAGLLPNTTYKFTVEFSASGYSNSTPTTLVSSATLVSTTITSTAPALASSGVTATTLGMYFSSLVGAVSYTAKVYSAATGGSPILTLTNVVPGNSSSPGFTITGLSPSTTYYVSLTGIGDGLNYLDGPESTRTAATTNASTILTIGLSSSLSFVGTATTSTSVTINSIGSATGASYFNLKVFQADGVTQLATHERVQVGSVITGLSPGTRYAFKLQAIGDGVNFNSSADSAIVYVTTIATVGTAPTQLIASIPYMNSGSTPTTLAASAPLPSGAISTTFKLYASDQNTLLQTITGASSATTFSNVLPNTNYYVSTVAVGDGVDRLTSIESAKVLVTTPPTIKIGMRKPSYSSLLPTSVTVSGTLEAGTALSWIAKLYAADNSTLLGTFSGSSSAISLVGLTPDTIYNVRMSALGDGINSLSSDESVSVTFRTPLNVTLLAPQPTINSVWATSVSINLTTVSSATSTLLKVYAADGTTRVAVIPGFTGGTLTGLNPSTTYFMSFTSIGNGTTYLDSAEGAKFQFTTSAPTQLTPPGLSITTSYPTTNAVAITLTYNQTPAPIRYVLKIYGSNCSTLILQNTNYTTNAVVSGLAPNTQYCAKVISIGDGTSILTSAESPGYLFTTAATATLINPVISSASATSTTIAFAFSYNSLNPATSYTLRLFNESGTLLSTIPNYSSSTNILGLTPNTLYRATLQAIGNGTTLLNSGESVPFNIFTTSPVQLAPPAMSSLAVYGYGVTLAFTATANSLSTTLKIYSADCSTLIGVIPGYTGNALISVPLVPATSYCASLIAIGNGFNFLDSDESAKISFTTPAQMTLLAPTYRISSATSYSVTAAIESTQNGAVGYLYRVYAADASTLLFIIPSTSNSVTVNSLLPSSKYYVSGQVIGNGLSYLTSPEGPKILATTSAITVLPIPNFTINVLNATTIGLVVASANASSFTARIYSSDGATLLSTSSVSSASSSLTAISGLTPATTYQVSVVAIGDGTSFISSPESAKATVTTLPLTTTPTVTPTMNWIQTANGKGTDYTFASTSDNAGNVYTVGYFQVTATFGSGAATQTLTSFGGSDIYIAKYSSAGVLQWVRQAGGTQTDVAYAISFDKSSGLYISGYFQGAATFGDATSRQTVTSFGGADGFIAKFGTDGSFQWVRQFGGTTSSTEIAIDVDTDGAGSAYVIGYTYGYTLFGSGPTRTGLNAYGNNVANVVIAKYLPDGTLAWSQLAGGSSTVIGQSIAVDAVGNSVVVGYYNGGNIFFGKGDAAKYVLAATTSSNDAFIAKFTSDGDVTWVKSIGGTNNEIPQAVAIDGSGNVYVTGYQGSNVSAFIDGANTIAVTNSTPFAASNEIFLAKYTAEGALTWARLAGGTGSDVAYGLAVDTSGNAYITGAFAGSAVFSSPTASQTVTSVGNSDIFVARYSSRGEVTWVQRAGGTLGDLGRGVAIDPSGRILVVGQYVWDSPALGGAASFTLGAPGQMVLSAGQEDGFLVQMSPTTTSSMTLTAPLPYVSSIKSTALNVTYNLIPGAVSYTLKVYAADGTTLLRTIPTFRSGGTVTGLTVNTNYKFSVTAIGDSVATFSSNESALVSGATQISSPTPIISLVGVSTFRVSFNTIPGVAMYSLNLYAADGITRIANYVNVPPTAYTISNLVPGATYKVSIRPIGDGSSTLQFQESAQVSVTLQSAATLVAPISAISISTPSSIFYNAPSLLVSPQMLTGTVGYLAKFYRNDGTTLIGALASVSSNVTGFMPASTYKVSVTSIGDGLTYLDSPEGALVTASTWQSTVLQTPQPSILPAQVRAQQGLIFPAVYGAIGYIARIYSADGTLLNTIPNYTSGADIAWDFLPGSTYQLSVQALGDGWNFYTSPESPRLTFTRSSALNTTLVSPTPVVGSINANSAVVLYQMAENIGNYTLNVYAADGTTLLFRMLNFTSSASITNLLPNTTYKIGLVAIGNNSTNATSAQSPLVTFITSPATTLIAPVPSVTTITPSSFNVTFTAVTGATVYALRIYAADGTTLLTTIPNFSSGTKVSVGLIAGATYRMGLIAYGDGVAFTDSTMSELVSVTLVPTQTLPAPAVESYYPVPSGFKVNLIVSGAASVTLRVYSADGNTLLLTQPQFSSGTLVVAGLLPSTTYRVTGQAIGDGFNYANSVESEKFTVTTGVAVTLSAPIFAAEARDPRTLYTTFALPYGATTVSARILNADGSRQIAYIPTLSSGAAITNLLPGTTYRIILKYRGDTINFLDSADSAPVLVTTPEAKVLSTPTPSLTFVPGGGIRLNSTGLPALATSSIYYGAKLYASDGTTLLSTMSVPLTGITMYGFTPGTTYKISMKAFGDGYYYLSSPDSSLLSFVAPTTNGAVTLISPVPVISAVSRSSAKLNYLGTPSAKAVNATIYAADGTTVLQYLPFVINGQLISNLAASTTYKIKLQAIGDGTSYMTGTPSALTTFTTSPLVSNLSATQLVNPTITIANRTSTSFQVNIGSVLGALSYTFRLYASDGTTLLREVTNFNSGTAINNLLVDTNYYVTVRSLGDEVNYATSGEGAPMLVRTGLTPPTPVISSIVAGNSDASITITFSAITGATTYQLKRYAADGTTLQATTNNFASGTTITGLSFSTTYKFALVAVGDNTSRFTSSSSALVTAITPAQITLAKPVPTISNTTATTLTVSFPAVTDALSYTANVYSANGTTLIRTLTNYTSGTAITGLTGGLTYKISVTAIGNGTTILDSLASDQATGITVAQVTLAAPTASVASATTTSITITFTPLTGAQSYLARMYSAEGSILINDFAVTPGSTISALMPLTSYKLSIKAIGDGSSYLDSVEGTKVTISTSALTTLATPTPVLASSAPNELSFTFANIANASSYTARLYTDDGTTVVATTTNFVSGGSFIGLNPGTGYRIRLQALGDGVTYSTSVESPSLLVATVAPVTLTAPTPTIASRTSSSITVTFTAAIGALRYKAVVYDSTGQIQIFADNNANPAGTTISGLQSNTTYKVALSATGDETNFISSSESAKVSTTTNQAPTALISPVPALTAAGSTSMSIFYNPVVGATSYTLKIYNAAGNSLLNTITNFAANGVVTGLTLNTTYKVSLTAIGDGGFNLDGADSSKVSMATAAPTTLGTPSPATLSVTSNSATITFAAIDGAFDYTAKVYASNGTTLLQTITSFNSGDAVTGLSPTTSYRVSVTAIGDGISVLDSAESTKAVATTSAPTALASTPPVVAAVSTDSLTVIFTPITGAISYTLKLYNAAGSTLLSTLTSFNSGDVISSLSVNTTYQISLTSIGDGVNWNSSSESATVSATTDSARTLAAPTPTVTSRALTSFAITFPAISGATSYRAILYSSNGSTVISTLNNFQSGNIIGGLTPSTQYYVSLTAIGNATTILTSLESDSILATTTTQPSLSAPTPTVSNITTTSFNFTYSNITNALSYNAKIYTDQYGSNARTLLNVSSPTQVTGLTPGQTYYIGLQSIADGTNYLNSAVSTLVQVAIPNLVTLTAPTLTAGSITPSSIALNFTPVTNASSYTVRVYSDNVGTIVNTLAITSSPVTASLLSPDTPYYFSIQSMGDGTSYTSSGESTLLILRTMAITTLRAPTPGVANITSTSAKATFTSPAGALSNTVKLYGADGVTLVRTINNYTSGTTVSGLTANLDYYFTVTSIGDGSATLTSTESAQTLFTTAGSSTLTQPAITLTGTTYNSFVVTFTPDPDALSNTIKLYDSDLTTVLGTYSNFTPGATISNLQALKIYGVSITAIGDGTNFISSVEGPVVQVTTLAVPVAPPAAPSLSIVTPVAPVETKPEVVVAEPNKDEQNVVGKVDDTTKVVVEKKEEVAPVKKEPTVTKTPVQLLGTNEGAALNFVKDPNIANYTVTVINPATGKVVAVIQNYQPGQAIAGIEPGVNYLISLTKTGIDGKVTTSLPTAIQGVFAPAIKPTIFGLTSSSVSFSYPVVAGAAKYRIFITDSATGRLVRAVESTKNRVALSKLNPTAQYSIQVVAYTAQGKQLSKKGASGLKFVTKEALAPKVKSTIRCISAAKNIKVTGFTPKCPAGYRLDETSIKLGEIVTR